MTTFIDTQRVTFGVEPICQTLEIAPSSYYAARARPPSARSLRDEVLEADIGRIHRANYAVYGARQLWRALRREGSAVGRDRVARLMRGLGLAGAVRGKVRRTTVCVRALPSSGRSGRASVQRARPEPALAGRHHLRLDLGRLRLHRLRHRRVQSRDRRLAGVEQPAGRARPRRPRDGDLEPALRGPRGARPPQRSRRPVPCDPLHRAAGRRGAVTSVGSRGDSYDNALAETVNGLYKTELIRARGPWRTADQVELATAAWVAWWNEQRLHSACGDVPPAEFEAAYHQRLPATTAAA